MTRIIYCSLALISSIAVLPPSGAAADEAYICEGGRIQYVKPEELAQKKLTDPCIAGYYGLLPMPPAAASLTPVKRMAERPAPLQQKAVASAAPPVLKKLSDNQASTALVPSRTAAIASPEADFRNVRVINAAPGEDEWFRHGK